MRLSKTKRMLLLGAIVLLASQSLSGCSSSEMSETDAPDALIPPPEAGTDPIPEASAEMPAPSADVAQGDVPPPDIPPSDVPPPAEDVPPPVQESVAAPPVSEPVPEQAQAGGASGGTSDYTTRSGDTLMKIAFETYGDLMRWREILEANRDNIPNPNRIPAGTVLKLATPATPVVIEKNGERYNIRRGDTLGKISRELYGTPSKWKALWKNNRQLIKNPNKIYAGFDLYYQPMSQEPTQAPAPLAETPMPADPTPREPAAANPQ